MDLRDRVLGTIYGAVDEINGLLPPEKRLEKSPDSGIYGAHGRLDSIQMVSLIVAVESGLQNEFQRTLTLATEKAFSQKSSPFLTLGSLADFVCGLLEEPNA